jgi:elongation factor Ts
VIAFRRYEVGEGIEKRQEDFAAEVAKAAAAVQG